MTHATWSDVVREVRRLDRAGGERNYPHGTGAGNARKIANALHDHTRAVVEARTVTWRDIVLVDVAEAFAKDTLPALRTQLVRVAADIVRWVDAIDRETTIEPPLDTALGVDALMAGDQCGGEAR